MSKRNPANHKRKGERAMTEISPTFGVMLRRRSGATVGRGRQANEPDRRPDHSGAVVIA